MTDKLILSNQINNKNNVVYGKKTSPSKKGRGAMNIIKVALYMLKQNKAKAKNAKSAALPTATNVAALSRLVVSVRPLHLQNGDIGGQSPPPPPPPPLRLPPASPKFTLLQSSPEWGEAVARVVVSPRVDEPSLLRSCSSYSSLSQTSCSSSSGGMSSYTSAQNLYDLDDHDDEVIDDHDRDAYYDGLEGDEMIDAKAEMFIAKFYQQMRLQTLNN